MKNAMTIHAPTIERCFASVAREVVDVAGEPTEIHQISAADPLMNVVIIPGNPGACAPPLLVPIPEMRPHSADAVRTQRRHVGILQTLHAIPPGNNW